MSTIKVSIGMGVVLSSLCISLVLIVFSAVPCVAQAGVGEGLSPVAQDAIDKGIIAAKASDYLLAIRHFEAARKIAPNAPIIFFNSGLAESKIPGRELRAIAWFAAYLAANPTAKNAATVKIQIDKLKADYRKTQLRVIKSASEAAKSLGVGAYLSSVAKEEARAGDIATALQTAAGMTSAFKADTYGGIAIAQAESGDFAGARSTLGLILDAQEKHLAQTGIVRLQVAAGDIKGARETWMTMANLPKVSGSESVAQSAASSIAEAQAKSGDRAGARTTIAAAIRNGENIKETQARDFFLSDIARAQARCGDFLDARKTADLIQDVSFRAEALGNVAERQAKSGEIAKALGSVESILEADEYGFRYRDGARGRIAMIQANRGDIVGARKTAELMSDGSEKASTLKDIEKEAGPKPTSGQTAVANLLEFLDESDLLNPGALNSPIFLDLPAYLKSFPAHDLEKLVNALLNTIDRMFRAQGAVYQLLDAKRNETSK